MSTNDFAGWEMVGVVPHHCGQPIEQVQEGPADRCRVCRVEVGYANLIRHLTKGKRVVQ